MVDQNPELVEQKRPLAIVVPGGSFEHLSQRESEPVALAFNNETDIMECKWLKSMCGKGIFGNFSETGCGYFLLAGNKNAGRSA